VVRWLALCDGDSVAGFTPAGPVCSPGGYDLSDTGPALLRGLRWPAGGSPGRILARCATDSGAFRACC
jgi:hypothetical protein